VRFRPGCAVPALRPYPGGGQDSPCRRAGTTETLNRRAGSGDRHSDPRILAPEVPPIRDDLA